MTRNQATQMNRISHVTAVFTMKNFLTGLLLFVSVLLQAQSASDEPILKQFASFNKRNIQEKLFVHTDKEFYLAGEIVWYKIYYMDGTNHRPLDMSKLAYVEILDNNNKPVMQGKNALKNSSGKGSFYLPSSINSGNFKLRAYTNWMKNFDAGYYFEKNICIINSLKPLNLPAAIQVNRYEIQFFPEGGNLVSNLENRIAFKVADQYGTGAACSGVLINEKNDTLIHFQPLKFGMGNFVFTPSADHTYKAVITLADGKTITGELPLLNPSGYVMRTDEDNNGNVRITVVTNITDRTNGAEIFLLAHTRQTIRYSGKKSFLNGTASFMLRKDMLGEGVSQITVFNKELQPVCERLVFKTPVNSLKLNIGSSAASFTSRNKVDLNVSSSFTGKPVQANMSLAVYEVDSLSSASVLNMENYLLLSSDIRGTIETPAYYFSADTDVKAATENLMMTQGWRRFTWSQPLRKTPLTYDFPPEYDGHIVSATITYTNKQVPAAGVKSYLSVPGNKTQFYASLTNQDGIAYYDIRDYYGKNEVVVQTEVLADSNYRIDITDPFSEKYSLRPLKSFNIDASQKNIILNHSLSMQTLNAYLSDSLTRFDLPVIDTVPFYGKYTKRYLLDDYVRFTTMEEVLREYVPEIGLKRTAGQLRLRISDWDQLKYLDGDPLILLDGVPVTHKQILAYDPMKVRKLEVVTNRYITGKFVFDGIASFNSYAGDMPEFVLDSRTALLDYEGLQLEREFYSPVYETENQRLSRMPDFRNVLSWQPDVKTNSSGQTTLNFYTSDRKGKFIAVLYGLDESGNAGTQLFNFEVK